MLGGELRKVRRAAGLTQEALAFRARVDRSYLSELERDLKSPTVSLLFRLCDAMGASASKVLSRVEKARRKTVPMHLSSNKQR
ncbi:MAG TPA: helix-turn-helix transcriptional regulator [Humisphaera sp.]|nr:helix-turn-helix transcriptional regulator [Humisphaera sp.]